MRVDWARASLRALERLLDGRSLFYVPSAFATIGGGVQRGAVLESLISPAQVAVLRWRSAAMRDEDVSTERALGSSKPRRIDLQTPCRRRGILLPAERAKLANFHAESGWLPDAGALLICEAPCQEETLRSAERQGFCRPLLPSGSFPFSFLKSILQTCACAEEQGAHSGFASSHDFRDLCRSKFVDGR